VILWGCVRQRARSALDSLPKPFSFGSFTLQCKASAIGSPIVKVKLVLPALLEASDPHYRAIKYSLFPPLGLATLAGFLHDTDDVRIEDEHVERLTLDDAPDLVGIQVYITNARRAYELADLYRARGSYVVLGGLHVTALPQEAAKHADTIVIGPAEDAWPAFLGDFRTGRPRFVYRSIAHSLEHVPPPRRDLLRRNRYLCPNSLVVSRGCAHSCDFCYKTNFFAGGKSFYTQTVDRALAQVESMPGRHVFFLDDNLFANPSFATALFDGMKGMGKVWQGAGTVSAVLGDRLVREAADCGLRSLFIGFETLNAASLRNQHKRHNLGRDYDQAVARLRELGVMINGSFIFGFDEDDASVFDRTVEWAVKQGIETATFHILTPYPGTPLHRRMAEQGRITTTDWDRYDTRHSVFAPARLTASELEAGYWRAYDQFYSWANILRSTQAKQNIRSALRHGAYTVGWKKLEFAWDWIIRGGLVPYMVPLLEFVLRSPQSGVVTDRGHGLLLDVDLVEPAEAEGGHIQSGLFQR